MDEEEKIINLDDESDGHYEQIYDDRSANSDDDDYSDVLQLTRYDDRMLQASDGNDYVAEYHNVDTVQIDAKYATQAKKIVNNITNFILKYDDVELTEEHKEYLMQVGQLQMQNLTDMLSLVEINKQMLENLIRLINASNMGDYAALASYNQLMQQQLKLTKELQMTYKQIPMTMKKMRNDILLESGKESDSLNENTTYTEEYGSTQFNNQKELIRKMKEEYNARHQNGQTAGEVDVAFQP